MRIAVGFLALAIAAGAVASAGAGGQPPRQAQVSRAAVPLAVALGIADQWSPGMVPSVRSPRSHRVLRAALLAPKPTPVPTPPVLCRTYGADATVKCEVVTCQYGGGDCIAYTTVGKVLATLTGLAMPQGVAADRQNNSYIANTLDSNVLKYTRSFGKLAETYQDPGQYPGDVDVDAPAKLLAASNIISTSGGPGSVSVYAGGATTPTAELTDPAVGSAYGIGIAIDKSGDCFWSLNDEDTGQGQIDEFKGCQGNPQEVVAGIGFAGGIAFDDSGNLFYSDQDAGAIYKCSAKGKCIVLTTGFSDPLFINFDDRWKFLWVADAGAATVSAVDRTSGLIVATFPAAGGSGDPPFGVAHAPGPLF